MNYFKSKTVWFGLALAILSWLQQAVPNIEGLTQDQVTVLGTIVGAVVIWLRTLTTTSISDKS